MEDTEIVSSPAAQTSPKEPSLRSRNSPTRQSLQVDDDPPAYPRYSLDAAPYYQPQPSSSRQPSVKSNRSKSPTPKFLPTQNNQVQSGSYKSPSPIFSPTAQTEGNMDNIEKIAKISQQLTDEANALRNSIKSLSSDIARTKLEIKGTEKEVEEDVNFPYHLFLIEIVINKIHMKCECFDIDFNNLVISAAFLGKPPIVLYDPSFGKIENVSKLNLGKSTLFAMTYDKICSIKEFVIVVQLTKQPPCSSCITKIGETRMDYTKEFINLREELCAKWCKHQPKDDLHCTTAMPLSKNMYYLSCGDSDYQEPIGVIEATVRMSFLGKEITTAYCSSSKPQTPSFLLKEDNGMTMYSCQKVEMDDQGKILLDEDVMRKKKPNNSYNRYPPIRCESPISELSSITRRSAEQPMAYHDETTKYDEIFTKMNANELKIKVPKSTKVERMGKYDKIQELCSCESTPYNTGEQIQFELPTDKIYGDKPRTHTSNFKYTYTGSEIQKKDKDRKVVNVTPTNCPVPVNMEKMLHPLKDVFILKIGKKLETKDRKTDLEIELVTPKAPSDKPTENTIGQQYSSSDLDKKTKSKSKGKKGKSKKGGKKAKSKGKAKGKEKPKGKGKKEK